MAFKEISTQKKFINYKECSEGDHLVTGKIIATKPNKYDRGQGMVDWIFETEDETSIDVVLNHSGSLAYLFKDKGIGIGSFIRVHYLGKETIEKGEFKGSESHQFKVEIDEEKSDKSHKDLPTTPDIATAEKQVEQTQAEIPLDAPQVVPSSEPLAIEDLD